MSIKIREEWKLDNGKYRCPHCGKEYKKKGLPGHLWRYHSEEGKNFNPNIGYMNGDRITWNKGLTKEIEPKLAHTEETKNKISKIVTGYKFTKEQKKNLSEGMKKAHQEGRAWNIGMSRWNNEPSYPEKFFMQVIENEFEDKEYIREYPVSRYSIDFAWVDKKLAIEIDGAQHEKEEYRERDARKDKCLNENGWKVLRIKWDDMFHNTKEQIEIAKHFIDQS